MIIHSNLIIRLLRSKSNVLRLAAPIAIGDGLTS